MGTREVLLQVTQVLQACLKQSLLLSIAACMAKHAPTPVPACKHSPPRNSCLVASMVYCILLVRSANSPTVHRASIGNAHSVRTRPGMAYLQAELPR